MINAFDGVALEALAVTVSANRVPVAVRCKDVIDEKKAKRLVRSTGIAKLSIVDEQYCTSDLCVAAAEALIESGVQREEIGAIIFITQTPDYFSPASAYIIQNKLGLNREALVFDINLGCSGFVYGLYVAASLLSNMDKKVLVCCGDTSSRTAYPLDTSMLSIAGDAGAAAVVSKGNNVLAQRMCFHIESFGERAKTLYMPRGAYRLPKLMKEGNLTTDPGNYGVMNGTEVMDFSLNFVPDNIRKLLEYADIDSKSLNYALLHQANQLMVVSLANELGLPFEKVPFVAGDIGNVSSASIPVCFTEMKRQDKWGEHERILLSGFGIGMSIASVVLENNEPMILETMEI